MRYILVCCLLLCSCFSRQAYISREKYDDIAIGTTVEMLKDTLGTPFEVNDLSGGNQEYVYVEKLTMGSQVAVENHYYFTVSGGHVISKRMTTEQPPAFDMIYQDDPNFTQNY